MLTSILNSITLCITAFILSAYKLQYTFYSPWQVIKTVAYNNQYNTFKYLIRFTVVKLVTINYEQYNTLYNSTCVWQLWPCLHLNSIHSCQAIKTGHKSVNILHYLYRIICIQNCVCGCVFANVYIAHMAKVRAQIFCLCMRFFCVIYLTVWQF